MPECFISGWHGVLMCCKIILLSFKIFLYYLFCAIAIITVSKLTNVKNTHKKNKTKMTNLVQILAVVKSSEESLPKNNYYMRIAKISCNIA